MVVPLNYVVGTLKWEPDIEDEVSLLWQPLMEEWLFFWSVSPVDIFPSQGGSAGKPLLVIICSGSNLAEGKATLSTVRTL